MMQREPFSCAAVDVCDGCFFCSKGMAELIGAGAKSLARRRYTAAPWLRPMTASASIRSDTSVSGTRTSDVETIAGTRRIRVNACSVVCVATEVNNIHSIGSTCVHPRNMMDRSKEYSQRRQIRSRRRGLSRTALQGALPGLLLPQRRRPQGSRDMPRAARRSVHKTAWSG
jgi:hypothetical protein